MDCPIKSSFVMLFIQLNKRAMALIKIMPNNIALETKPEILREAI